MQRVDLESYFEGILRSISANNSLHADLKELAKSIAESKKTEMVLSICAAEILPVLTAVAEKSSSLSGEKN